MLSFFLKNGLSRSESVRLVQTFLPNKGGNLQAGVELQLFKNLVHMAFNSEGGDMQVSGYFLVTQALGDQIDDLTLPVGKLDMDSGLISRPVVIACSTICEKSVLVMTEGSTFSPSATLLIVSTQTENGEFLMINPSPPAFTNSIISA